jgi:hypothetical protein
VADVTLASRLKWALLGVALTVLAWRVLRAGPPRGRGLAATTCAFAALAFAAGAATKQAYVLHIGLVGMLLGIGGLVWQTSRTPASPPGGDRPPG